MSKIIKSSIVTGKTIEFHNVVVSDAEFIYSLRSDPIKSKHISSVNAGVDSQLEWIKLYEQSDEQAYFIIKEIITQRNIGTVRIYDPIRSPISSFCWGSWILTSEAKPMAAIESALMIYEYGFDYLGFPNSHFDVRKHNSSVCKFHERTGAIRMSENETDIFYSISLEQQKMSCKKYSKYLPDPIKVSQAYVY